MFIVTAFAAGLVVSLIVGAILGQFIDELVHARPKEYPVRTYTVETDEGTEVHTDYSGGGHSMSFYPKGAKRLDPAKQAEFDEKFPEIMSRIK